MDTPHNTRKAARESLEGKGWTCIGKSCGDLVFTHPQKSFRNVVSQLKTGKWTITGYGFAPLDKPKNKL